MKTNIGLLLLVIVSITFIGSSWAADGQIAFSSSFTASTCAVDVEGQGPNATVTLPEVSARELPSAGSTAGMTSVFFIYSGCARATKTRYLYSFFESNYESGSGRLSIDNHGSAARNVEVELLRSPTSQIFINNMNDQAATVLLVPPGNQGGNVIGSSHYARYYATGPVAAGNVYTTVTHTTFYH